MFVKWDITEMCNLNCKHCKVSGGKAGDEELNTAQIFDIIDNLSHQDLQYIHFLGGEPFCKENILEIMEYCNSKRIPIGITTNGTLLNEFIINRLMRNIKVPLYIFFSLDGPNTLTNDNIRGGGVFNKCIKNLSLVSQYKKDKSNLVVGINATINKINKNFIDEYINLSNTNLVDVLYFSYIEESGNAIRHKNELMINDAEKIEAIEKLYESYAINSNFSIHLPIPPKVINYFNEKYKSKLSLNNEKLNCMVFNDGIRLDSRGRIYPCESRRVINKLVSLGIFDKEENVINNKNILDLKVIKEFKKLLQTNIYKYNSYMSNVECEYKKICMPCPMEIEKIKDKCNICNMVMNQQSKKNIFKGET